MRPSPAFTAPLVAFAALQPEVNQAEYWTSLQGSFFCHCPNEYSIERSSVCDKVTYTVMFGGCNHRHGYNITGRMPQVEVDYPRLKALVEMANLGLKTLKTTN